VDTAIPQPSGVRGTVARSADGDRRQWQHTRGQRERAGSAGLLQSSIAGGRADRQILPIQFPGARTAGQIRAERHLARAGCRAWTAFFRHRACASAHSVRDGVLSLPSVSAAAAAATASLDRDHVGRICRSARIWCAADSCSRSRCRFFCTAPPAPARKRSPNRCIARAVVGQAVRDGQLRGHSGELDRERTVRLYARSVHGAAKEGRIGKILQSNGGTLFWMRSRHAAHAADRLLRVIEEREVVRSEAINRFRSTCTSSRRRTATCTT